MTKDSLSFYLTYCEKCDESLTVGDDRTITIEGEPWIHHNPLTFCPKCHTKLKKIWNTDPDFLKANLGYHRAYNKGSTDGTRAPSFDVTLAERAHKKGHEAAAKKDDIQCEDITHGRKKARRVSA
jgi:hypothetical protein